MSICARIRSFANCNSRLISSYSRYPQRTNGLTTLAPKKTFDLISSLIISFCGLDFSGFFLLDPVFEPTEGRSDDVDDDRAR